VGEAAAGGEKRRFLILMAKKREASFVHLRGKRKEITALQKGKKRNGVFHSSTRKKKKGEGRGKEYYIPPGGRSEERVKNRERYFD